MLTLATWNIHRCIGTDGAYDPARIRRVLRAIDADVVALQEVEVFRNDPVLLDYLCEDRPWRAIHGVTLQRDSGHYGNAVLSRLPVTDVRRADLSVPGREPRGVLDLRVAASAGPIRVLATHLGLRPGERRRQVGTLLRLLDTEDGDEPAPTVTALLGDFNEWFQWGRPLRRLRGRFPTAPAPRTFPSNRPLFSLDHIFIEPLRPGVRLEVVANGLARVASDHLPLVARLPD